MISKYPASKMFSASLLNSKELYSNLALIIAGSLFLALMSQIIIPLWPVPFTLQTLGLIILAGTLGPKRASLAVITYLFEGLMGLPVFSGGKMGFWHLMGPTGGFLLGFTLYTYLYGLGLQKAQLNMVKSITFFISAEIALFASGLAVLGVYFGFSSNLFTLGFIPFIPGLVIKGSIGLLIYSLYKSFTAK
ncbi:Biotin transporter BioY [Candidatus Hepatincolaceae symbiont of Richtersius coronifer]